MPEDKTLPIIMICAGTGIAPFRGFWQKRKHDMNEIKSPLGINQGWGDLVIYFGCRQSGIDDLYKNEIDDLVKEKIISDYYVAYSRQPDCKKVK